MTAAWCSPLHLGTTGLKFAVADCLRDPDPDKRRLNAIMGRLWREPPEAITEAYDAMIFGGLDGEPCREPESCHGLLAARMRELRRPLPKRDKAGLPLGEVAKQAGMDRETLASLMEHHGILELVSYGGRQRRRLVTDAAFHAGLGHNVDPGAIRSPRLDGHARSSVFPVFYPDAVPDILWMLDWEGIKRDAAAIKGKRERMRWLLSHHHHLPDQALADLGGYSLRGVKKARGLVSRDSGP